MAYQLQVSASAAVFELVPRELAGGFGPDSETFEEFLEVHLVVCEAVGLVNDFFVDLVFEPEFLVVHEFLHGLFDNRILHKPSPIVMFKSIPQQLPTFRQSNHQQLLLTISPNLNLPGFLTGRHIPPLPLPTPIPPAHHPLPPLQPHNFVLPSQTEPQLLIVLLRVFILLQQFLDSPHQLPVIEVPVVGHVLVGELRGLEAKLKGFDEVAG
jgi:hypothetical protein